MQVCTELVWQQGDIACNRCVVQATVFAEVVASVTQPERVTSNVSKQADFCV